SVGLGQHRETCATDGRGSMKKLASFWKFVFLALAIPLLVSNCMETAQTNNRAAQQSTGSYASGDTAMANVAQTTPVVPQRSTSGSASASADTSTGDYRISSQDILQVAVFQVQDLNNAVQVGEDGNVALPLVGKIQLRGKTTYEAEQIIASK